jgi:hypothetical protein
MGYSFLALAAGLAISGKHYRMAAGIGDILRRPIHFALDLCG